MYYIAQQFKQNYMEFIIILVGLLAGGCYAWSLILEIIEHEQTK